MTLLHFFFFCSGLSGLIYQVVWVRVFGNVFGNTIYSASLVIAVFMLGLGGGSYLVGVWADRRYASRPESLLRAYAHVELIVGAMGLGISLLLPHLDQVSALTSSYAREPNGWYVLSMGSHLLRAGIAVVLLVPITLLMGGTLTLLIRHLVRSDLSSSGWRVAVLYAVNTGGAALGCFLTDFTLVPAIGLDRTQLVAVAFNVVAGLGALLLAGRLKPAPTKARVRLKPGVKELRPDASGRALFFTSLALVMSGFAAMGMEILWFRHFTILLGGFRAVFSLLLTVILVGIGAGSLIGGLLLRRATRPAEWLMAVQALFVVFVLVGLTTADSRPIEAAAVFDPTVQGAIGFAGAASNAPSGLSRTLVELWFNLRPMLVEVGLPALLMGFTFPLANAIVQRAERRVGRQAGALYLANTAGAVCGSLAAGFLLLPAFGIQASATVLTVIATLTVVPLYAAGIGDRGSGIGNRGSAGTTSVFRIPDLGSRIPALASLLLAGTALGLWLLLPSDYVNTRALERPSESSRLLTLSEGLTELIAVTEIRGEGRRLLTNGHPMSATTPFSQRYMRALAHIPLLSIDTPESVLVIGFGVGNTTHAATLHPSVRRVEVADLSSGILAHAGYFRDVNQDALSDPKVAVYVNDGRQHLHMRPAGSYDLITLEPPPIAYAGVAALYSKEFYALARSRLTEKGYVSQWLPAYQVPTETTLAMIRAFVDVFPQSVLLSGAESELLLLGTNDSRIEIDPTRLANSLSSAPAVQADLRRLDLGRVREIVGMFVGSAQTLSEATKTSAPISDDRPLQEYDVRSLLNLGEAVPASVVDLRRLSDWCPLCFVDGTPAPLVEGLDEYLALLDLAYRASPSDTARARRATGVDQRVIAGSKYLGQIVPESADLHNILGIAFASRGALDEAIAEFRTALTLEPESATTMWHLGAALASRGAREEAIGFLKRSVQLDPTNEDARNDLTALTRVTTGP